MIRALLGGSFDPLHNGHLALVAAVLERGLAEQVLVAPANRSPHKGSPVASGAHRLRMAELALAGIPGAEVWPAEVERGGISYTVDTLTELGRRWPADRFRLVLGADNLATFASWRQPEKVLAGAEVLVFARPGSRTTLPPELAGRAVVVSDFAVPVSATEVRANLAAGKWPADQVPAPVLAYIAAHGLYGWEG